MEVTTEEKNRRRLNAVCEDCGVTPVFGHDRFCAVCSPWQCQHCEDEGVVSAGADGEHEKPCPRCSGEQQDGRQMQ